MKKILGSVLGFVITLPVIVNAQGFNPYHPQQMRMPAPAMPYQMNRAPYTGRWNRGPGMNPAMVPMRPMMKRPVMYKPHSGRYGNYPVNRYQVQTFPRRPMPAYANTQWRNYGARPMTPNQANRHYARFPAYGYRGYRAPISYPQQVAAYLPARQVPSFQRPGWRQVSRTGNIIRHNTWRNVPPRVAQGVPYAYGRYTPARRNPYASPSRAYWNAPNRNMPNNMHGITRNRFANNWRQPAWQQYRQAQQHFMPGRYVIPAQAMKARGHGFQGVNTRVKAWRANPNARNYAGNMQPRTPRSYRAAYDFYRR